MNSAELTAFVETAAVYFQVAKKHHGAAWLCSLRGAMCMSREEFDALAFAAHQAGLLVLARADLIVCEDVRYLTESELCVPNSSYTFHFLREII